ncbi:uncharacterized protein MELLADRAFT_91608 [Melampsora larici-populina 98AG31]|uniref:Secreted protein n=1 Tax=Melampsora larici-populina (strain 98AG31 / pathotype 3-4-7) TaxID=747676 RepID=F4RZN1_MELLP|nr:uncharacterized protein MELLADRAFT_91608 [Melampsora larici-populina 98AG31]EGG02160.1 secreted protein [Melampsora larici-populina 98AG31]
MLQFCLKISSILLFLWIHSLKVAIVDARTLACNIGFSRNPDRSAKCTTFEDASVAYKCDYATCWNQGHQWVLQTGCQLVGSGIKGTSQQHCSEYYDNGSNMSCKNPSGVPYTCGIGSNWMHCDASTCKTS